MTRAFSYFGESNHLANSCKLLVTQMCNVNYIQTEFASESDSLDKYSIAIG